jgi:hypothetical protein
MLSALLQDTPYAVLSHEMKPAQLRLAGIHSRAIEREVGVAGQLHLAWGALEANDLEKASIHLRRVSSKLTRQAAKLNGRVAKAPQKLAAAKRELAARLDELGPSKGDADLLAGCRDSIVTSLKGRWGTEEAHTVIEAVRIKGQAPPISSFLKDAELFEIGAVEVRKGCKPKQQMEIALKFAVPPSFNDKVNEAVGPECYLFAKNACGDWVHMTGSPITNNYSATTGLYQLTAEAVNTPEIKECLCEMLLKRIGWDSMWHRSISMGDFYTVPLGNMPGTSLSGLLTYQLAIVPDSTTPELNRTMATITENLTKAGHSYFTVGTTTSEECCEDSAPA